MTLAKLIALVDEMRPNHFDKNVKTAWVNEIEQKVVDSVINRAFGNDEEFTPYEYDKDYDKELLVPDSHNDVYQTYIFAKMDYINAEMDRYMLDAQMHDSAYSDYSAEYRRNNYPKPFGRTFKKAIDKVLNNEITDNQTTTK